MTGMITARPIIIRGAMVSSSTVAYPDTGETAWANATAYVVGDTRAYLIDDLYHRFECKLNHTSDTATGKIPEAYPDDENNAYWIDLGAVNKYAPFQLERNTQNSAPSPYIVAVVPGERFTSIALGNVVADDVTLEVLDSSNVVVKTETKRLLVRDVYSWYDWLYQKHRQIQKTIFTNLPAVSTHKFRLTFNRSAGPVKVGFIIPGVAFEIGQPQYKANVARENFAPVKRDAFGEAKLRKGRNIPGNKVQLIHKKTKVDGIKNLIDDLNGEVTFWSAIDDTDDPYFESLMIIGFYREYSYSIEGPVEFVADIDIQEL